MKFAPDQDDHLRNLTASIATMTDSWAGLQRLASTSPGHVEFCYVFIRDFVEGKPYALSGGPSTLVQKVYEAVGTGGANVEILTQGLMKAEKLVPGVSSVFLAKLGEVTRGTDRAGIVEELCRSCGIVNKPSGAAMASAFSMDKPKGMH